MPEAQFLSHGLVADIKAAKQTLSADVSRFFDKDDPEGGATSEQIRDWALSVENPVLDISKAQDWQIGRFEAANELLPDGQKITLLRESDDALLRRITGETLLTGRGRQAFHRFVLEALANPELVIDEHNLFTTTHNADKEDVSEFHYLGNMGLLSEGGEEMHQEVLGVLDEIGTKVEAVYMGNILPGFKEMPQLRNTREQILASLEGLASNAVRGQWYNVLKPESLRKPDAYRLRVMAVDFYSEFAGDEISRSRSVRDPGEDTVH